MSENNVTHIANARSSHIWICFHEQQLDLRAVQCAIEDSKKYQIPLTTTWVHVSNNILLIIPSREFHRQIRTIKNEYITVINSDGGIIVENYGIPINRSYIITRDGAIKKQKYGCPNLFEDEEDRIHY